ncbi:MAG TPA: DUF3124 domain-containing protein [bacterium]|nr:DUF3124 domain-containing protein [bacterium]
MTLFCLIVALGLGCSSPSQPNYTTAVARAGGTPIDFNEAKQMEKAAGQTLYVPVYSHIYHRDDMVIDLTATLSIRNTDINRSIIIQSVKYYDTAGKLVRGYTETPLILPAMATLEFVVGETDRSGGSGANFVVEWFASEPASAPIVEAVMIGTHGQQGISFLSTGRVIADNGAK